MTAVTLSPASTGALAVNPWALLPPLGNLDAYIAAVNPQVGLALIERVRTLTAQLHATALAEHRLREALTAVRTDWLLFARPHSDDIQGTINDIAQSALATPPTEGAQQVAALIAAAKEISEDWQRYTADMEMNAHLVPVLDVSSGTSSSMSSAEAVAGSMNSTVYPRRSTRETA